MPILVCVSGPCILWPPLLGPCPSCSAPEPRVPVLLPSHYSAGLRVLPEHWEVKQLVLRHNEALAEKCCWVDMKEEDHITFILLLIMDDEN